MVCIKKVDDFNEWITNAFRRQIYTISLVFTKIKGRSNQFPERSLNIDTSGCFWLVIQSLKTEMGLL